MNNIEKKLHHFEKNVSTALYKQQAVRQKRSRDFGKGRLHSGQCQCMLLYEGNITALHTWKLKLLR